MVLPPFNLIMRVRTPLCIVLLALLATLQAQSYYNHQTSGYLNASWMGLLDNGIPLRKLSIVGSHSSMSTGVWGDAFQTQSNSLTGQLVMGMRALDIRCRHFNNAFPVHDRLVYLNTDLGGVLTTVRSFLQGNPTETVLMHIVEEYNPSGNSRSFEDTYISYRNAFSDIIWLPTTQNPILGEVRGKVVVIQNFPSLATHGLLFSTFISLPHKWFNTNWDLYDKWTAVKNFLTATNTAGESRISFWTGHGGSFPYFVASGKSSPGNTAPRLATGLTTPGFSSSYPDFPRVACFIGICTIAFEGINILGFNFIQNNNLGFLGIIFTDFLGDVLLQKVVSRNTGKFVPCSSALLTQGCTYCSSTGQCLGCNMTLHYIYAATNFSCLADNGYFLQWSSATVNVPVSCSVPMIGCLSCSSGTVCTLCDTFANYQLVSGSCAAAPGFYLNASGIPVKCTLVGCYQCISATTCAVCSAINNYILVVASSTCVCDTANLFVQAPSVDACICQTGYFLSSNGTCELIPLCAEPGSGCLVCNFGSPNSCSQCDTAYYFEPIAARPGYCSCMTGFYFDGLNCTECNATLQLACSTCASGSLCLTCVDNFTLFNGDCICLPQYYVFDADTCLQCPIGCLRCDNASVCILCDAANNFTLISSVCECNAGMFLSSTICEPCGAMVGCVTCNTMGCTGCDPIFGFNLNATTSLCQCSVGFFVNAMFVCEACSALGCLECTSNSICTVCDTTLFTLVGDACQDICGDGILYTLPCDDGNNITGDGCSADCQVEQDYTCVGGSTTSPSLCSFSGTITVTIVSVIKDPSANRVYLQATISPALAQLGNLDFNMVFVPNFPVQSSTTAFDPTTGSIAMIFDYNQSLNNQALTVTFEPPAQPAYFYMKATSATLPQTTDNNLALKTYDSSQYEMVPLIDLLVLILAVTVASSFLICFLVVSKLMAIEMILIYQLTYSALMMIKKLELFMLPLRNLWIVNGYNKLLPDSPASTLPGRISEIYYKADFLSNFSIDVFVVLIPILVGSCLVLIGKVRRSKTFRLKGYRTLKQWLLSALLFVQIHLDVSIFLGLNFASNKMISLVVGIALELLLITQLVIYIAKPNNFGEYKKFFRQGRLPQCWYLIVFLFRTAITVLIGNFGENEIALFASVGLAVLYLILQIIFRPYISNARPTINSLFILLILGVYIFAKINQNSQSVTFLTSYIALILMGVLFTALLFNIVYMIVYKILKCKQKKEKIEARNTLEENETESKQMDKIYINKMKEQLKDSLIICQNNMLAIDNKLSEKGDSTLRKNKAFRERVVRLEETQESAVRQRLGSQTEDAFENQAI